MPVSNGKGLFVLAMFLPRRIKKGSYFFRNCLIFQCSGRQDSNLRPSGYEPDELPTAPPRDISILALLPERITKVREISFLRKGSSQEFLVMKAEQRDLNI